MEKRFKSNSTLICSELECAKKCHLHDALRKVIKGVGGTDLENVADPFPQNIGAGYFSGCDLAIDSKKLMLEFGIVSIDGLENVNLQECFLQRIVSILLQKMGVSESELLAAGVCPQQMLFMKILEGFELVEVADTTHHNSAPWPLLKGFKKLMKDLRFI